MSLIEHVIGRQSDTQRFDSFLADWESILGRRVDQAVRAIAAVPGVYGLVLAGSLGRAEPWPLSDIDLLPIYEDDRAAEAQAAIDGLRRKLLEQWADEGWWTGLDIGSLVFGCAEVESIVRHQERKVLDVLRDDRWYHSVDKGCRGRAAYDPYGLAAALARWLTDQRFSASVVNLRLQRAQSEIEKGLLDFRVVSENGDVLEATRTLRLLVKWLQTRLLEKWGERDNSFGRVGTRFERIAMTRGESSLMDALHVATDLDDDSVRQRMALAPDWVWERHDRSWRARRHIGEEVTQLQDARDVLRVCTQYAMRSVSPSPYPSWLAIPAHVESLNDKAVHLTTVAHLSLADTA